MTNFMSDGPLNPGIIVPLGDRRNAGSRTCESVDAETAGEVSVRVPRESAVVRRYLHPVGPLVGKPFPRWEGVLGMKVLDGDQ